MRILAPGAERSRSACAFLDNMGVGFSSMNRAPATLLGRQGAAVPALASHRLLARSRIYILDEPSIELHQRDNNRLIAPRSSGCGIGNTVLVVEHDEDVAADHLVDMGPGAGGRGHVVPEGTADDVAQVEESLTGQFLAGTRRSRSRGARPTGYIWIEGAFCDDLQKMTSRSRSGCSAASPGSADRAGRRWSTRCSTRPSPTGCARTRQRAGAHRRSPALTNSTRSSRSTIPDQPHAPLELPATYIGLFDQMDIYSKPQEARGTRLQAPTVLVRRQGRSLRSMPTSEGRSGSDPLLPQRVRALRRGPSGRAP